MWVAGDEDLPCSGVFLVPSFIYSACGIYLRSRSGVIGIELHRLLRI